MSTTRINLRVNGRPLRRSTGVISNVVRTAIFAEPGCDINFHCFVFLVLSFISYFSCVLVVRLSSRPLSSLWIILPLLFPLSNVSGLMFLAASSILHPHPLYLDQPPQFFFRVCSLSPSFCLLVSSLVRYFSRRCFFTIVFFNFPSCPFLL